MKNFFKSLKYLCSFLVLCFFFYISFAYFNGEWIWNSIKTIVQSPFLLLTILSVYLVSFCLKALAWKMYLNGIPRFSTCLLGIIYSLFINHLSPIKVGDFVRMRIMSTRDNVSGEDAAHSVVVLRLLDMICLIAYTLIGLFVLEVNFEIPTLLIVISGSILITGVIVIFRMYPEFVKRQFAIFMKAFRGRNGLVMVTVIAFSWILEAVVIYGTITIYDRSLSIFEAIFANSITVSGQVFQITPGGIANYESFLVFALGLFGFSGQEGYTIAIVTHAIKFFFSYSAGLIALLIYPIPFKTILSWSGARGVRKR